MKNFLAMLFSTATLMASAQDTSVIKMEYFIDQDPGVGKAMSINIPAGSDVTFPFTVNTSSYPIGYHKLYIRTRDNLGRWSLTAYRSIEVIPTTADNNVVNGEYFIDTDPGFGNGSPITISTAGTEVLQNFTAATTGLTEGFHKLYGRVRDTHGNWSQTFRRNITIIKSDDTKVINGEYFFKTDNGFGNCPPVVFTTPSADGTFTFTIPAGQIPSDADTLFVRVRNDIENRWSLTRIAGTTGALPLTLLNFSAVKQFNASQLHWQTANEVNTAYFNVQRSTDATHFTTVGKVVAKGNPNLQNDYGYSDDIADLNEGVLYYRLQMVDQDGHFTFSKIVSIRIEADDLQFAIYPNPAQNYFVIEHNDQAATKDARVLVRDMEGRTLINQQLNNSISEKINITGLSKGVYMVSVITGKKVQTKKLVVE